MSLFSAINADPVIASEIMEALDIDMDALSSPASMKHLEEVVSFFTPYENRMLVLSKLTGAKPGIDKMSHILDYIRLRKVHSDKLNEIEALGRSLDASDENNALILLKQQQVAQLEEQLGKFE